MTARVIHNIGTHIVEEITGDEVFSCRAGSQRDKEITAEKLRHYFGGDIAAPNLRTELGAHATKLSELANAEFAMRDGDLVTGLQDGKNVNFSRMQILKPLLESISAMLVSDLAIRSYKIEDLPEPVLGMEAVITNCVAGLSIGDAIAGFGAKAYKAWYNGREWTVTGI